MRKPIRWQKNHKEWLEEHRFCFNSYIEIRDAFNKQFNETITENGVIGLLRRDGGNAIITKNKNRVSQEQLSWIKKNYDNGQFAEKNVVEFNKIFGTKYKRNNLTQLANRNGIKLSKETQVSLKRDTLSQRLSKPIGSEYITKNGYTMVKVSENKTERKNMFCENWQLKQQYIWEKNFGKIPRGYNVSFIDGNKQNCDINNLILMTKKEQLQLITIDWIGKNEITKAGLEVIRTEQVLVDKGVIKRQKYDIQRLREHKKKKTLKGK